MAMLAQLLTPTRQAHVLAFAKRCFPLTRAFLLFLVQESGRILLTVGEAVQYTVAMLDFIKKGRCNAKHVIEQLWLVLSKTMPLTLLLNTLTGAILALQLGPGMKSQGAEAYVGTLIGVAMVRELGPVLTAFSGIAMIASSYAAELATMQITQQVQALQMMHVSPIRYWFIPRVLSLVLALPVLLVLSVAAAIVAGYVAAGALAGLSVEHYFEGIQQQLGVSDLLWSGLKTLVFGYISGIFACTIGFGVGQLGKSGSQLIGQATTRAVVWAFLAIAVADYLITTWAYGQY